MREGYRFRLVRVVDRSPDFVAPAGLTGTVTVVASGIWAKMDQHIPGAEHWDNELHWGLRGEFLFDTEPCG